MQPTLFGQSFHGQTTIHPLGAAAIVVFGLLILILPRRHAIWPILLMAAFISPAQRIVVFSLDFNMLRIMVVFGWLRVLIRNELGLTWNRLDTVLILWTAARTMAVVLQGMGMEYVVLQLGRAFDAIGLYFLFRWLIRDWDDVRGVVWAITVISIPVAALFFIEYSTKRNLFSVFGGVPEITNVRDGRLRCQGAFSHPILAGCFWGSMLPLVAAQIRGRRGRFIVLASIAAICFIVIACSSSTPVMAVIFGIIGCMAFAIRRHMSLLRWATLFCLLFLSAIMNKPVWHLISRIHVVGGSTSWHRYNLIDQAIKHADEWFFLGSTKGSAHWGWSLYDITNDYVVQAMQGGILQLVLFIAILVVAFAQVGRLWRHVDKDREKLWMAWGLGVCLFAHALNFIAVSYFGQSILMWFLTLALIGSLAPRVKQPRAVQVHLDEPVPLNPAAHRAGIPAASS